MFSFARRLDTFQVISSCIILKSTLEWRWSHFVIYSSVISDMALRRQTLGGALFCELPELIGLSLIKLFCGRLKIILSLSPLYRSYSLCILFWLAKFVRIECSPLLVCVFSCNFTHTVLMSKMSFLIVLHFLSIGGFLINPIVNSM